MINRAHVLCLQKAETNKNSAPPKKRFYQPSNKVVVAALENPRTLMKKCKNNERNARSGNHLDIFQVQFFFLIIITAKYMGRNECLLLLQHEWQQEWHNYATEDAH